MTAEPHRRLAGGIVADATGLTATLLGGATVVLVAARLAPRCDMIDDQASEASLSQHRAEVPRTRQ